jgi:RNA polymerase sigma-70 factor (ECF subfamily)
MSGAGVSDADTAYVPSDEDVRLVAALRAGDEQAFMALVTAWSPQLLRVARMYVSSQAVAEDVVQETWLAVLSGLDRFEGRSSLRTWVFRILTNRARTRGAREARSVPFSALADEDGKPAVDPSRFLRAGDRWEGGWASPPQDWDALPEQRLLSEETLAVVRAAIDELPPAQRAVITLRDLDGFDAPEVCELLDLSEGNQRVLLHRARSRVRRALEAYLDG